jgi:hypothetical protein
MCFPFFDHQALVSYRTADREQSYTTELAKISSSYRSALQRKNQDRHASVGWSEEPFPTTHATSEGLSVGWVKEDDNIVYISQKGREMPEHKGSHHTWWSFDHSWPVGNFRLRRGELSSVSSHRPCPSLHLSVITNWIGFLGSRNKFAASPWSAPIVLWPAKWFLNDPILRPRKNFPCPCLIPRHVPFEH